MLYFAWKNKMIPGMSAATTPTPQPQPGSPTTNPTLVGASNPAMSQPASVSQPAPQSQAQDMITPAVMTTPVPVSLSTVPAVFSAGSTSAETEGNASAAATPTTSDPFAAYPAGFQTWANSLGPQNRLHLLSVIKTMTPTDINFINNMVAQNLWGSSAMAPQWNAFVKNYGFPVAGGFNNYNLSN